MAIRKNRHKAYRPSSRAIDVDAKERDIRQRSQNVEEYAIIVSRGLRLFEDGLADDASPDDNSIPQRRILQDPLRTEEPATDAKGGGAESLRGKQTMQ